MIEHEGYGLVYLKNRNAIEIWLPPTRETLESTTMAPYVQMRRVDVKDKEFASVLLQVVEIFRKEVEQECDS